MIFLREIWFHNPIILTKRLREIIIENIIFKDKNDKIYNGIIFCHVIKIILSFQEIWLANWGNQKNIGNIPSLETIETIRILEKIRGLE